jgi:hypothetical protein
VFALREKCPVSVRLKLFVGKIVLYKHPRVPKSAPALVTLVLPDTKVNATVFVDSGRTFPVYGLPYFVDGTDGIGWDYTEGDLNG